MSGNQSSLKILLPGENVCGGINIFFVEGACLHSPFYFCCRFRSRWLRIPFEEFHPKLKGNDKLKAEACLRTAMEDAHKSIPVVTCHIASAIKGRLEDDDFLHAIEAVEEFAEKNSGSKGTKNVFSFVILWTQSTYSSDKQLGHLIVTYKHFYTSCINPHKAALP